MYFDVDNVPEKIINVGKAAPLSKILQTGTHILLLGETSVGKTTLISSCVGQPIAPQSTPARTIKFNTNTSTITEITGLHTSSKNRGQVWTSIIELIATHTIDITWFCVGSDFVDNNDELWHWMTCLSRVCHVVLVRTKCLTPSERLREEVAQQFPVNAPPPVVCVLARDIQLNPKGGGAVLDAYGLDDLANVTEEALRSKRSFSSDTIAKLQKQAKKDEARYEAEEAQKGVILNSLRSLSSTDENSQQDSPTSKKDSLGEEEFEMVPRPESPGSGFVHMMKSKKAVVGAVVAFAVLIFILL